MASIIRKLDESVINRIAAGEVVQRPSAAIKEMIENSLDAGSTSIVVSVKGGGLQLLQIQDNGHGIKKECLDIVCERFTTSKLSTFEDLKSISTFGFRGEALASITHVAHVSILTKTKEAACAYKAKYSDGKLVAFKAGEKAEPKPCAGMVGTTITVEDLFYNMNTRKQAFRNLSDEYQRILDVITRYSIRYGDCGISFTCKKHGQAIPDLHTPIISDNATGGSLENIRIAYGASVAKELINFSFNTKDSSQLFNKSGESEIMITSNDNGGFTGTATAALKNRNNDKLDISVEGKISNANYSNKKAVYIFFINNRLVECPSIRKTIDAVYSDILPRHAHPFVYLSFNMPPEHLDVNVHPTKKEVHFLHEEDILERLYSELTMTLRSANDSRSFQVQTLLPLLLQKPQQVQQQLVNEQVYLDNSNNSISITNNNNDHSSTPAVVGSVGNSSNTESAPTSSVAANKFVRTDPTLMKINAFFKPAAAVGNTSLPLSSTTTAVTSPVLYNSFTGSTNNPVNDIRITDKEEEEDVCICPAVSSSTSTAISSSIGAVPGEFGYGCLCCGGDSSSSSNRREIKRRKLLSDSISTTVAEPVSSVGNNEDGTVSGEIIADSSDDLSNRNHQNALQELSDTASSSYNTANISSYDSNATTVLMYSRLPELTRTSCQYQSILSLITDINSQHCYETEEMLKHHTFVGAVDCYYSLLQHGTKLMLVDHSVLLREMFYQIVLLRFGEMDRWTLSQPVDMKQYLSVALAAEVVAGRWIATEEVTAEVVVASALALLQQKADMLNDYFKIQLTSSPSKDEPNRLLLHSLPILVQGYQPLPEQLPSMLLRLCSETIWDDEMLCFQTIAATIADYYCQLPVESSASVQSTAFAMLTKQGTDILSNLLYPAMRLYLIPQLRYQLHGLQPPQQNTAYKNQSNSIYSSIPPIIQIAALEQLYKVFERC